MNSKIPVFFIAAACFSVSCKNDDQKPVKPEEVLLLTSYEKGPQEYFLEYNEQGLLTNIETPDGDFEVVRDSEERVTSLGPIAYSYNSSGLVNVITANENEALLEYNINDMPAVLTSRYEQSSRNIRLTRSCSYNELNQVIEIKERFQDLTHGTSDYSRFTFQYDEAGNIIKRIWESSSDDVVYSLSATYTYTYDDKKNPWYTILTNELGFDPLHIDLHLSASTLNVGNASKFRISWISKNNIVKQRNEIPTGWFDQFDYTYTYNENGYPTAAERVYTSSENPSQTNFYRWHFREE